MQRNCLEMHPNKAQAGPLAPPLLTQRRGHVLHFCIWLEGLVDKAKSKATKFVKKNMLANLIVQQNWAQHSLMQKPLDCYLDRTDRS